MPNFFSGILYNYDFMSNVFKDLESKRVLLQNETKNHIFKRPFFMAARLGLLTRAEARKRILPPFVHYIIARFVLSRRSHVTYERAPIKVVQVDLYRF